MTAKQVRSSPVPGKAGIILIASSTPDYPGIERVVTYLDLKRYELLRYDSYKVARGTDDFCIKLGPDGSADIRYNGRYIDTTKIVAAWYRRPNDFGLQMQPIRAHALERHYRNLQEFLWQSVPARAWLNNPNHMQQERNKLSQLVLAKKVGFNIPPTVITNQWNDIDSMESDEYIFKMPSSSFMRTLEETRVLYSTIVKRRNKELQARASPYPGMWQPYIAKKREWRVTVVGEQVFAAAVYTRADAKDDWRKHQGDREAVQFKVETASFPKALAKKCVRYLRCLDLRYGAFDFIEQPDGHIVFLEVNLNGQYLWLEEDPSLESGISKAIAGQLMNIALAH